MSTWNGRFVGPAQSEVLEDDAVPAYAVADAATASGNHDRLTTHIDNPVSIQASPALVSACNGQPERPHDIKVSIPDRLSHDTLSAAAVVVGKGSPALAHSVRKPWRPVGGVARVLDHGLRHPPPNHIGTRPHDAAPAHHRNESLSQVSDVASHAFVLPEVCGPCQSVLLIHIILSYVSTTLCRK